MNKAGAPPASIGRFSAKVIKRAAQIRRLGPGGIIRTAYIRTLGPTVHRLGEPARRIAAAAHVRKVRKGALPARLARLKTRVMQEAVTARGGGQQIAFGGDLGAMVATIEAMLDLRAAGCSVAGVVAVDWDNLAVTPEAIAGRPPTERSDGPIHRAGEALLAIHRAGYVVGRIGRDDLIISDSREPVVVNLRRALPIAGLSRDVSVLLRDLDRQWFNDQFGTDLLTAARLRQLMSPTAPISRDQVRGLTEVYAPVVIRNDIRWGKIWNTDLGEGRWNFIMKQHLPIPVGGSVLDLGTNNGFNPLQMLRAGAASAVGVEILPDAIEQGELLKAAYEWLDNRSYDYRYIQGSQADLPSFGLPKFDQVTAFCSLYYLSEQEIRELVHFIRALTDVLVLQCNTDRLIDRGGDEEMFRKASVPFAIEMLEQAGFTNQQIIAPRGYSRPLVIGRAGPA